MNWKLILSPRFYATVLFWTAATVGVVAFLFIWFKLPSLTDVEEGITITRYNELGEPRSFRIEPSSPVFVRSQDLPRHVVGAILVSEDSTFFDHKGIDWFELKQAVEKNLKEKRYARGASTITQQIVKNAFLTPEKTLLRKLIEALTALRLEIILTKEELLNYYLNLIELGPDVYGLYEGAKYYFKTEPTHLTPKQAALLAFFTPNPRRLGEDFVRGKPSKYRERRLKTILRNMELQHYLDDYEEVEEIVEEQIIDKALRQPN